MTLPRWIMFRSAAPPLEPPPPTGGGTINLVGNLWTPARDGQGRVLASDAAQLPMLTPVQIAGTTFATADGSIMEYPPYTGFFTGADGRPGTFNGWSGAARSDDQRTIIIRGGGHAVSSTCDNPLFRWDIDTLTPVRIHNRSALAGAVGWQGSPVYDIVPYDTGDAIGVVLKDNTLGAVHTYYGDVWLPPSEMNNATGGVVMLGWVQSVYDLDTNTYGMPRYVRQEVRTKNFSNIIGFRAAGRVWWLAQGYRWEEFNPHVIAPTDHSPASRGIWTGRRLNQVLPEGGTGFVAAGDNKFCVRMPTKGWVFNLSAPYGAWLTDLGAAAAAAAPTGDSNISSAHHKRITLTSSDGSHNDLLSPANLNHPNNQDGTLGNGLFTNAPTAYDDELDCIWLWGNLTGAGLYRIDGVSTGTTWTVTKVATNTVITPSAGGQGNTWGYGTYDRCIFGRIGGPTGPKVFAKLSHVHYPGEIIRLA